MKKNNINLFRYIKLDRNTCDVNRYLDKIRKDATSWPVNVRNYVIDSGNLNPNSPNWIHDSWITYLKIYYSYLDNTNSMNIDIELLGPFHDRYFKYYYKFVKNIETDIGFDFKFGDYDLIADELLFVDGHIDHIFLFSNYSFISIIAQDFEFEIIKK